MVLHALMELAPRQPDLAVVGINYGENVGNAQRLIHLGA